MKKQLATLLAVTALGIGVLSGCGVSAASNSTGSSSDSAGAIEITNVSYDPTRELAIRSVQRFICKALERGKGTGRISCSVTRWFRKAGA